MTEETKQSLKTLTEEKEDLFEKQKTISDKIKSAIEQIKVHRDARDTHTKFVHEEKKKRDELNAQIKEHISQIKEAQPAEAPAQPQQPYQGGRFGRDRQERLTPKAIEKQIEKIQFRIETEGLPFDKEQKLMKELKEKKKLLAEMGDVQEKRSESSKLGRALSKLKKESDVIHKAIQENAQKSQEEHEKLLQLSENVDKLRAEEKEIRTRITELKSQIKEIRPKGAPRTGGKRRAMPKQPQVSAEELEKRAEVVEEKIKGKKKLTTEDLLALQAVPGKKE
jgi:uncharacterized coiled-coil DUF342 family protein